MSKNIRKLNAEIEKNMKAIDEVSISGKGNII